MPQNIGNPVEVKEGRICIRHGTIIIKPRKYLDELLCSTKTKQDVRKFLKKSGAKDIKFSPYGIHLSVAHPNKCVDFSVVDLETIIQQAAPRRFTPKL